MINNVNIIPRAVKNIMHPLFFIVLKFFLYETPETAVLIEKPLLLIVPALVRILGEILDLLMFNPKPPPRFILF